MSKRRKPVAPVITVGDYADEFRVIPERNVRFYFCDDTFIEVSYSKDEKGIQIRCIPGSIAIEPQVSNAIKVVPI